MIESSQITEAFLRSKIGKGKLMKYREQFRNTQNFITDDSLDILEH